MHQLKEHIFGKNKKLTEEELNNFLKSIISITSEQKGFDKNRK